MMSSAKPFYPMLTGNQLKLFALISMTVDHLGRTLWPQVILLQILGRLSFPIFAYMIAEGCLHTKDRKKYLLSILLIAAVCQIVFFVAEGSLYMSSLVAFCMSLCLIYTLERAFKRKTCQNWIVAALVFLAIFVITVVLPILITNIEFEVDYGFWGVLMPVGVYFAKRKPYKLLIVAVLLLLLSITDFAVQTWSLLTLIPLALYNGKRGTAKLKYFFYLYFPLHLAAIHLISLICWH